MALKRAHERAEPQAVYRLAGELSAPVMLATRWADGGRRMMADRDRHILDLFAARVRQHFPTARIWAFGSRARGDSTWESDLDVCVVLDQYAPDTDDRIGQIA